jgi:alkylation response protein AidB-like acyl-CoA dehydrogenase
MPEAGPAEHELLRQSIRDFVANMSPETEVRRLMATPHGFDHRVWSVMAGQLGLQGMAIPERYGGAGFGWTELAIVLEEFGRALLCAPYFATVALAVPALLGSDDEDAKQRYLPAIASGELVATVAVQTTAADDVTARDTAGGYELYGRRSHVIDGCTAGLLLVPAIGPAGLGLFAVEGSSAGLARDLLPTLDQTRKQAEVVFDGCPARPLGPAGGAAAILARVECLAAVALACEQVGGAQHCLDDAVGYARDRMQFGRPIGSFQAVRHRCADMLLDVESARSMAACAVEAAELAPDSPRLGTAAHMAKAYCSEAFVRVAAANIQVHGGIGITWDHSAHLYLKRAKSGQLLFGSPQQHRAALADLVRSAA